ncbi:hypothetical protein ACIP39_28685 [Streptomyces tibetensis]|uniref:hypothetical protein n=1 Tax=Streptomyces tibetensis TaxID=2382123 RepID=UPI00381FC7CD
MLDPVGLRLPLEEYQFSDAQWARVTSAQQILAAMCMRRFGLRYAPVENEGRSPVRSRTDRRYGLADPGQAWAHGYQLPADGTGPVSRPVLSDDQATVLEGRGVDHGPERSPAPVRHRGKPVPEGGCMGEARRALVRGGAVGEAEAVRRIDTVSVLRAMEDPRVRSAFDRWSACMEKRGYAYDDPWQAINDEAFRGPAVTPREIATAVADVTCKRETNIVGVWCAVDAAYQRRMLAAAGGQRLKALKQLKHGQLAAASGSSSQGAPPGATADGQSLWVAGVGRGRSVAGVATDPEADYERDLTWSSPPFPGCCTAGSYPPGAGTTVSTLVHVDTPPSSPPGCGDDPRACLMG